MLPRLREILLTQYIGAIVTALMIVDAIGGVFGAVVGVANGYYMGRRQSAFGEPHFDWGFAVPSLIRAVLYVAISYFLIRWLYLQEEAPNDQDEATAIGGEN